MFAKLLQRLATAGRRVAQSLRRRLLVATKPSPAAPHVGTLADLVRSKPALVLENALLRQQLIILRRGVKRPHCTPTDRALLVLLASRLHTWRHALLIVQPDTLLRWHRELFRRFWRRKSHAQAPAHRPPLAPETVTLIREMAVANRTWGAERIRGELLKLGIGVAKSTIQRYMRGARPSRRSGQTWSTFLRNHGKDIWAADFLPVTDLLFRQVYAFFVIEIASRRVVHVGVTSHPTGSLVAQQLREATPFGRHPKHLIVDNDSKYGEVFARVARTTSIELVHTAFRAPKENAICERFLGSVKRECLDHLLILSETHLRRILLEYTAYFNQDRPHQGLHQRIPGPLEDGTCRAGTVRATPVLGGLHHTYRRAA
ncbi:MAG TPA: integrase core domain-containing protein [Chloroflexota bacterium]|nr:integrase core domain-containing protein [Chloroflexota bacterium]